MWKTVSVTVFALFALISLANAQEEPTPEDIFRYFPEGNYLGISHKDNTYDYSKVEAGPLFKHFRGKYQKAQEGYTSRFVLDWTPFGSKPLSFTRAEFYTLIGETETLTVPKDKAERDRMWQEAKNRHPGSRISFRLVKDYKDKFTVAITYEKSAEVFVYRFDQVSTVVNAAIEAGSLEKSGKRMLKLPIYKNKIRGGKARFYYATHFNELLRADTLEMLKQMIRAGLGLVPNMLEDTRYVDLIQIVPGLTPSWWIDFDREMERRGNLHSIVTGSNADNIDEEFKALPIFSVNTFAVSDEIVQKKIMFFEEEKYAQRMKVDRERYVPQQRKDQPASNEAKFIWKNNRKSEVDGKIYTETVIFDKKLLKAFEKMTKESAVRYTEAQKEKSAEAKEKK